MRSACVEFHRFVGGAGYLIVPFQLLNSNLFLSYSSLSCSFVGTCSTICHAWTGGPTACVVVACGCCVCCVAFCCNDVNICVDVGVVVVSNVLTIDSGGDLVEGADGADVSGAIGCDTVVGCVSDVCIVLCLSCVVMYAVLGIY